MILKATDVGNLVRPLLSGAREGRVTRVFQSSAYVEVTGEFVVLLNGRLRSPMTVNLQAVGRLDQVLKGGERCRVRKNRFDFEGVSVDTADAELYSGSLGAGSRISPLPGDELARGMVMLRMLRDASPPGLDIFGSREFAKFVGAVLSPLTAGEVSGALLPENYVPLLGMGSGFTPAGDDFVGGFTAAFNHMAMVEGTPKVSIERAEMLKRTVPESAALLDYAQHGSVDEDFERLVLSATGGEEGGFTDDLLRVAKRGHTSGIDMSSGTILCAAAIRDRGTREGALEKCLLTLRTADQGTL